MKRAIWMTMLLAGCADGVDVPEAGVTPTGPVSPAPAFDAGIPRLDADLRFDAALVRDAAARPDAVATLDGGPPTDAGFLGDAGSDAAEPDAAEPDAEPDMACLAEVCNSLDDDCDGVADEAAACPCEVAQYRGAPYLFCDDGRDWPNARQLCQAVGYDLVVVDSAAEDAFVYAEMSGRGFGDTWIGLSDRANEGQWVWLDGFDAAYTHWDSGEPNNGGGGEDCALVMTSRNRQTEWDDRPCDQARPFVCARAP